MLSHFKKYILLSGLALLISYHVKQSKKWSCPKVYLYQVLCQKLGKIFTGMTYKLLFIFTFNSDVNRSFTPNKTF